MIYGQATDKTKSNLKKSDFLNIFTKVLILKKQALNAVKSMLKAYVFQKDTQARLGQ